MVATCPVTASELWELGGRIESSELIQGELKPMVLPGGTHRRVQLNLGAMLHAYADQSGLGRTFGEIGYILQRDPDTVLAPELSVVAAERLPADLTRYLELAPDLAVEIVSPGNALGKIERELAIHLESGVRSVWVVYPIERQIVIHHSNRVPRVIAGEQPLEDPEVLPGFSAQLARVFGDSDSGGQD